jgi:glycosyltransferase involved in cell wall biosynthesis
MISVGAAREEKGAGEFCEAFISLAPSHPGLSAIWVGEGDQLEWMRRRADQRGLGGRLILPGAVAREDAIRYMQAADVLAFGTHAEGLPNVVVEAMACGLPVVAAAVGGIPEVVVDGVTGRLVPARDAGALAAAVLQVLEDARASAEMAARARAFAMRYFDGQANSHAALEILRRVVEGTHLSGPLPVCANMPPGRFPLDVLLREPA